MTTNRFDLLRLVFAAGVTVFHAVALTAIAPDALLETSLGALAEFSIQGFFIVSGALVFGSLMRSDSLGDYAEKRVRRLYPAYAVIILVPALVSLIVAGPGAASGILRYLGANLVFLNFLAPDLPGLFDGQRFEAVNGALWTLKVEVMFYLALPFIAWLMRRAGKVQWVVLVCLYVAGEAWRFLLEPTLAAADASPTLLALAPELARQLPGQMAFFASGMGLWLVWEQAKQKTGSLGLMGLALFGVSTLHPVLEPLRPAGLAGLIAWAAFAPGPLLNAARYGDISYGLYITHFPILQGLIMAGVFATAGLSAGFAIAALLTLASSFLLWWFVEKPALRRDSHYRQAAKDG
ncbi:acyltransferase [Henriciella barbarensis]|uniref:Acyltransferase n=1 Tax=Henriciella barbarensis TaxID=86342 RepID=A0A399R600_9PROT|nr:acyltransferase [Henriciella barbarensis]